jgi:hypothetical protein
MSQKKWPLKQQSRDFAAHLAREKSTSMQELYNEFEKYCKLDNDLCLRLEEHNQNKQ